MSKPKGYKSKIAKNIMAQIESGKVKMRPHFYYTLMSVLGVGVLVLIGFAVSYLMSIVTLWIRIQQASGPAYGAKRNLSLLAANFPWWALVTGVILIVLSILLIRKFGNLYKIKMGLLVPLIILIALVLGIIFSYSSLPNLVNKYKPQAFCQQTHSCSEQNGQGHKYGQKMK